MGLGNGGQAKEVLPELSDLKSPASRRPGAGCGCVSSEVTALIAH